MKILLLSKYPRMGASSRLRTLQYIPSLETVGVDVVVSPLLDESYLHDVYTNNSRSLLAILHLYFKRLLVLLSSYKYDLIWIEKEVFPYLPAFAERWLNFYNKPYIVDYDDAIFHNYDMSGHALVRHFLGRKIDKVMFRARCVVVGNHYLAERARAAGASQVHLVPTVVDQQRYALRDAEGRQRLVIGWIGSPSTEKYVVGIREALEKVCKTHDARLMLVGASSQISTEFPGLDVEVVQWCEDREAELIGMMDVGIMPLPDGPWEKGKCGYKLIQYMACGVPVIASPVGVNVDIVKNSECGFLADSGAEWERSLHTLLVSPELRGRLGARGRIAVETTYSLQVQAPVLCRILHDAIDGVQSC